MARAVLPTRHGNFTILGIEGSGPQEVVVVLRHGPAKLRGAPLVRIHSQCLTGDVLASQRCDCRAQLEMALRKIAAAPSGLLLYVPQEGRGIGLINKIHAYELQDQGLDTVAANAELGFEADLRDYRMPAQILKHLGAVRVRLLSNNPEKVQGLEREGITIEERIPLEIPPNSLTRGYLKIKKEKLGHLLSKV